MSAYQNGDGHMLTRSKKRALAGGFSASRTLKQDKGLSDAVTNQTGNQNTGKRIKAVKTEPQTRLESNCGHEFSKEERKTVQTKLLNWYYANYRVLPWRNDPKQKLNNGKSQGRRVSPYAVWVSEVMLQQTRVSTVIDYFQKWIIRFPDIPSLAKASLDQVNEAWAGLGYYRRAAMLHKGAQYVVEKHNGQLPDTVDELLLIPGIGKYTAGAIASIAFHQPVGAVDGNVIRIFSRWRCLEDDPQSSSAGKRFWAMANSLVQDIENAGDLNQALMDLGSSICSPKGPNCFACPVSSVCLAYQRGRASVGQSTKSKLADDETLLAYVEQFPPKVKKSSVRNELVYTCVVSCRDLAKNKRYLMVQRGDTGLLAGLWEFPSIVLPVEETRICDDSKPISKKIKTESETGAVPLDIQSQLKTVIGKIISAKQIPLGSEKSIQYVGTITHKFSHIHHTIEISTLDLESLQDVESGESLLRNGRSARWLTQQEFETCAVSTQMKKVFSKLANQDS